MCLAMNPDKLSPEALRLDSNRNFEGRQGFKGRTHLVSPAMAAAAAIAAFCRHPGVAVTAPSFNVEAFPKGVLKQLRQTQRERAFRRSEPWPTSLNSSI